MNMVARKIDDDELQTRSALSPIDSYIGSRLRILRTMGGLSQERLAQTLKITFQQVQKYELGINRLSASRMFALSRIFQVPLNFFFDEMPESIASLPVSGRRGRSSAPSDTESFTVPLDPRLTKRETLDLVHSYYEIPDQAVRKQTFRLIKTLSKAVSENEVNGSQS